MIDMKKILTLWTMLLFLLVAASSAHASVTFGPTDHFVTLDGRFNYTFATIMSFSQSGVFDDGIMLNYENLSFIPHGTGTGTGTINSWTNTMRDITVCTNDTELNMSFVNLTASSDLLIVEDNTWYFDVTDNTNYTFNATSGCKQILIYDVKTEITSSTATYPSAVITYDLSGAVNTIESNTYSSVSLAGILPIVIIGLFMIVLIASRLS